MNSIVEYPCHVCVCVSIARKMAQEESGTAVVYCDRDKTSLHNSCQLASALPIRGLLADTTYNKFSACIILGQLFHKSNDLG